MKFEWDENKRLINLEKHGVDFIDVALFDFEHVIAFEYVIKNELRVSAFGYVDGRLHCLVYTLRGDVVRVISLRKANEREVKKYG
jgi:uncharacterized protein